MNSASSSIEFSSPASVSLQELLGLRHLAHVFKVKPKATLASQTGAYRSRFKGRGMEFDEARPYVPGDDIRTIDWKVTARTNKLHTKVFREEREKPVHLCVDLRSPMMFATRRCYKSVWAAQAAALIAWSVLESRDRVGGLVFSDQECRECKPRFGSRAVIPYLRMLAESSAWQTITECTTPKAVVGLSLVMADVLTRLRRVVRPGSQVIIISDFRGLNDDTQALLFELAQHNELALLHCYDVFEQELPVVANLHVSDGRGDLAVNASNSQARHSYQEHFQDRHARLEILKQLRHVKLISCPTHADPLALLSQLQ